MDRDPCIEREHSASFRIATLHTAGSRVGNCRTVAARNKGQARCPAASSCAFQTVARGSFVGVSCVLASRRNLSCRPRRFFGFLRIPAASSCLHDFRLRDLTQRRADQSLYEKRILPNCLWGWLVGSLWRWPTLFGKFGRFLGSDSSLTPFSTPSSINETSGQVRLHFYRHRLIEYTLRGKLCTQGGSIVRVWKAITLRRIY